MAVTSYVKAKKSNELQLDGIAIDCEFIDGYIGTVTLTDPSGHVIKFGKPLYDSLHVYVPAPPKTEKRYVVAGNVAGIPIAEMFEDSHTARERLRELERAGGEDSVMVEERDVPVEL